MICNSCYGSGEVRCWKCEGNAVFSIPCEDCHGAGTVGLDNDDEPIACETCGGHGNREGVCASGTWVTVTGLLSVNQSGAQVSPNGASCPGNSISVTSMSP
jgi:RecJ-like exonuclease